MVASAHAVIHAIHTTIVAMAVSSIHADVASGVGAEICVDLEHQFCNHEIIGDNLGVVAVTCN